LTYFNFNCSVFIITYIFISLINCNYSSNYHVGEKIGKVFKIVVDLRYFVMYTKTISYSTSYRHDRMVEGRRRMAQEVFCPYCKGKAKFMSSREFYGRDYGSNIYVCRPCDAYVGTHKNSTTPLGTLANGPTREWRKYAHSKFDPMWKYGKKSRSKAYEWMRNVMGLTAEEAHIGRFNVEQCMRLVYEIEKREEQRHAR
jgi:hypothetical protein